MTVQRLNLSDYRRGTEQQQKQFARRLVASFSTRGFVKLDGHGFDAAAIRDMLQWNHRFFELPVHERISCAHVPGPWPQRGYSAVGGENFAKYHSMWTGDTPPEGKRDHKELYDIGPDYDVEYPNRWPEEAALPGFRTYMENTFRQFEKVSLDILAALEVGMGIRPGSLTKMCDNGSSEFRLIHYPSMKAEDARGSMLSRAWPHYDIGVISLLFQDNVGGLEIDDGHGGFESVITDDPTDLIVNASETIQRWTNDRLKAGLHRVTIPPTLNAGEEAWLPPRHSVVYFCKANRMASVAPLSELVIEDCDARYDDMTFLAYHQKRIQSAYA